MLFLQGVHHIALNCRNPLKTAAFFRDILEVPISLDEVDEGQPIYFMLGAHTRIGLHQADAGGQNGAGQVDHVAFSVATRAEIDYLVDKLEVQNIPYRGPIERPTSYNLYFETPDGHHLEVRVEKDEQDEEDV